MMKIYAGLETGDWAGSSLQEEELDFMINSDTEESFRRKLLSNTCGAFYERTGRKSGDIHLSILLNLSLQCRKGYRT